MRTIKGRRCRDDFTQLTKIIVRVYLRMLIAGVMSLPAWKSSCLFIASVRDPSCELHAVSNFFLWVMITSVCTREDSVLEERDHLGVSSTLDMSPIHPKWERHSCKRAAAGGLCETNAA